MQISKESAKARAWKRIKSIFGMGSSISIDTKHMLLRREIKTLRRLLKLKTSYINI